MVSHFQQFTENCFISLSVHEIRAFFVFSDPWLAIRSMQKSLSPSHLCNITNSFLFFRLRCDSVL